MDAAAEPAERQDEDAAELERIETREWLASLEQVMAAGGPERVERLLADLERRAAVLGVARPAAVTTPYVNTIPPEREPEYPGDLALEGRLEGIIRWNALAMVVRANQRAPAIGGHLSTYASTATLFEVAFNHFLRARAADRSGDQVYFQGHAAPGVYARAFLEGRLTEAQLENFRRELAPGGGLPSYPHPWLLPDFWELPTVSMGLAAIMAIYQARFNRYLEDRGLARNTGRVWAFLGDGEMDEPESVGALAVAAREQLDNLTFVVNCNLQRLDGPVRGNGKIIQELEATFRGAGWNVIKVIWGSDWDDLLARDLDGRLVARMEAAVDGDYQRYAVAGGAHFRRHFFGADPALAELVEHLEDEELRRLRRGGHDPRKVYAAYRAAEQQRGMPTVVLAKTIKGFGLGAAGEGTNVTHQQKKLGASELAQLRTRLGVPIRDEELAEAPLHRPPDDDPAMRYLHARRAALGGFVPQRQPARVSVELPPADVFAELHAGSGARALSTTMAFVRLLTRLLKLPGLGPRIVPIIPDEARTFGMEPLFRKLGIYSRLGQRYEPVDKESLFSYHEARDGQLLEEGITEAGAMASFIAAGTAHATHQLPMLPFFMFYSMFGFQRVGDLIWAAGDMRCRGFLVGCTAGRTTLLGEGLQHQDGHSQLVATAYPTVAAYDPAFAYELAVIVEHGIHELLREQRDVLYYLTLANESYEMPGLPEGARDGIVRGIHRVRGADGAVCLLASGPLVPEALRAGDLLQEAGIAAEIFSVTSWKRLYEDGIACERANRLAPEAPARVPFVRQLLGEAARPVVVVSDYVQALPLALARWLPGSVIPLGTDGFGRSDTREALRDFFEVSAEHVAFAALGALAREGRVAQGTLDDARARLRIRSDRPPPWQQ